jgi:diguanylate cyclase (GGDEF)-like protein
MLTEFPIQGILDRLVERMVEVLPVTAAGVTLIAPDLAPHYLAASDENAQHWEKMQTELGQGPCLLAYQSGERVLIPDLLIEDRFPTFQQTALAAGLSAVFTFPLRHGDGQFGALDLYRAHPGPLDVDDLEAAQTLADVAAAYVLNAQARADAREITDLFRQGALHDPLTGLANRTLLRQRLEHAAARARRSHAPAAVVFVDLDRFKPINDIHGHDVGDQLLCAVARRLTGLVRPGDTLARPGGDEFVFLCEDLTSAADVDILAHRISGAFSAPFFLETKELSVSASVGIAYAGPGQEISTQLIVTADSAMYRAKRNGGGTHHVVDLRPAVEDSDLIGLETELARAFADGELKVAYQPIVRTSDGRMTGVEALLRWTDRERGAVASESMVQVAEQSGLITSIGAWVLEQACEDRQSWIRNRFGDALDLSVNVSPHQLINPDFCSTVATVLECTGMDPSALTLEMTESVFIENTNRVTNVIRGLKSLGVNLALDDFGTGYSSLGYLRRFAVDNIKIDRSFIDEHGDGGADLVMVEAITHLAHDLGLTVTAEGIETLAQHDRIAALGCEKAQGYLYGRPMSSVDIATRTALALSS